MITFNTRINGVPCQVEVAAFYQGRDATLTEPPEYPEMDFVLLDRKGRRATWLERYLNKDEEERLLNEYIAYAADYYCPEPDEHTY